MAAFHKLSGKLTLEQFLLREFCFLLVSLSNKVWPSEVELMNKGLTSEEEKVGPFVLPSNVNGQ